MDLFKGVNRIKYKLIIFSFTGITIFAQNYKIVDTGQQTFYGNLNEISEPGVGESFWGQDAQYFGSEPSYNDNNDGTITDNVTGMMWAKSPDLNGDGIITADDKLSQSEAAAGASSFNLGGYNDWRLPSIKELYSLIMFYGVDPSGYDGTNTDDLVPFINTEYFDFGFGDTDAGERIIDAQMATSTIYVSTTMNGDETMFGVNFADGRIKGYPTGPMPGSSEDKGYYVYYVRGNTEYGKNDFITNGNGTITDNATGLMWTQNDNGEGLNWEEALDFAEQKNEDNHLGYNDWRLPNVKELQSIVDYSKSPATSGSPAIDDVFECTAITDEENEANYPFYWSGTTHANMQNGGSAAYVCFGEALGWMEMPPNSGSYTLLDVHGAGAQRSDPKTGNADDYPYGHGPQGDVIRIKNYVRLVRDANVTNIEENESNIDEIPDELKLHQNYPNPFNPTTTIEYSIPASVKSEILPTGRQASNVKITIYDILGNEISTLVDEYKTSGNYEVTFNGDNLPSGIYFYSLTMGSNKTTKSMVLMK